MPKLVGLLLGLQLVVASPVWMPQFLSGGSGRNIRHLPCVSRRSGEQGTCMFAFSCAKANGTHLGTCIDRFYFGSCCHLPGDGDNNTLTNHISPGGAGAATFLEVRDKPTRRPTTAARPITTSTEPSYQLSTFQSVQDNNAPSVVTEKVTNSPPKLELIRPVFADVPSKPRPSESVTDKPRPSVTNRPPSHDDVTSAAPSSVTSTSTESLTVVSLITKPTSKPGKPVKPVKTTPKPVKTTPKPTTTTAPTTTPKPVKTTVKPVKKPAASTTPKPVKLVTKPTTPAPTTTPKPVKTTAKPVKATTPKPVKTTQKPVKATPKPVKKPVTVSEPVKKPVTATEPVKKPVSVTEPVKKPVTTTEPVATTPAATSGKPKPTKPPRPSSKPVPVVTPGSPGLVTWSDVDATSVSDVTTQKVTTEDAVGATNVVTESWVLLPSLKPVPVNGSPESSSSSSPSSSESSSESSSSASEEDEETVTPELIDQATTLSPSDLPGSTPTTTTMAAPDGLNMSDFRAVCGRRLFPEARVVGGEKSTFGKWPWQISLRQWRTSTYLHKCGAALLNENWAITAAHCVENVPPSDLLLRLGEHDLSTEDEPHGFQERRVQIVAAHPQFDPRTFEYDLALLRFYEPAKFQPNVLPVCVPQDDTNFVGATAHVTGWGRLYEDGPLPSVLQEVRVPIINNTLCETMYRSAGYIEHIPEIFICAGWKKGGFDSCEGDSGGPMVIQRPDRRWLLAGVISWGIGCAEPNQPGVYTRISEFRDWINQILQF